MLISFGDKSKKAVEDDRRRKYHREDKEWNWHLCVVDGSALPLQINWGGWNKTYFPSSILKLGLILSDCWLIPTCLELHKLTEFLRNLWWFTRFFMCAPLSFLSISLKRKIENVKMSYGLFVQWSASNPDKVDMLRTQLTKVYHPEVRGGG